MAGRKGSPKMAKAAQLLIENPNYSAKVALLMEGYYNSTATSERAKKTLSKNKNRLIQAVRKSDHRNRIANYRASIRNPTVTVTTGAPSETSDLTQPSSFSTTTSTSSTSHEASGTSQQSNRNAIDGASRSKKAAVAAKPVKKLNNCSKVIAADSRRTPAQVNKYFVQNNKAQSIRETVLCRSTVAAMENMSGGDVARIAREIMKRCQERGIQIEEV